MHIYSCECPEHRERKKYTQCNYAVYRAESGPKVAFTILGRRTLFDKHSLQQGGSNALWAAMPSGPASALQWAQSHPANQGNLENHFLETGKISATEIRPMQGFAHKMVASFMISFILLPGQPETL